MGIRAAAAGLLVGLVCTVAGPATAQTAAERLVGTWTAQSVFCGESTVIVTAVEPNGTVRGTFECKRTGWKPAMGDKIEKDAVKGALTGNRFVMENAEGGGFDLELDGGQLKGFGRGRAGSETNPIIYSKQ